MSNALDQLEAICLAVGCHDEFVGILEGKSMEQIIQEKHEYMFGNYQSDKEIQSHD